MDLQRNTAARLVDICAYIKCNNSRLRGNHLYCFPKESNPLRKEWILRVGNPALQYYASSTIRRMGICAEHFLPEMFKPNRTQNISRRKMLKMDAVPQPPKNILENEEGGKGEEQQRDYQQRQQQQQNAREEEVAEEEEEKELRVNKPVLNYTRVPFTFCDNEDAMQWLMIEPEMTNYKVQIENSQNKTFCEMKLENECVQLMKENRDLKARLKYLKRKVKRIKNSRDHFYNKLRKVETVDEFLDRHGCKSNVVRTFIKLQLKGENLSYTTEEQDLAKMIFCNSASVYNKLRISGCHLPAESTIRRWV
ncbi:uncharacterized protein LOC132909018 [Bombus pascuorum]|uniref:uncharacterized protein LOC132909018 n=1 Tax=Bombus pascuorum TaxID=65598 RepID=UPI00212377E4|nr:uncharacterized protein LOC132909018 [Bombus pascuorum]XP_060819586.1 uncharacterized protein LOC132909018 [Bombus pascuorum]XP_060819587.1 uncharacterized protein LOC132909018 [Bombus pascuorum]XP_060819588.1 uncharacterized protein LOC132909018 [Bombus pascuorum]